MISGFRRFCTYARIWPFQWVVYCTPVEHMVCPATHNNIKTVCYRLAFLQSRNPSEIGRNSSVKDTVLSHFFNLQGLYLGAQRIFLSTVSFESYFQGTYLWGIRSRTTGKVWDSSISQYKRSPPPRSGIEITILIYNMDFIQFETICHLWDTLSPSSDGVRRNGAEQNQSFYTPNKLRASVGTSSMFLNEFYSLSYFFL